MNINQVWPEWNEDCVLGEGSFGKVYRAKRVEYGRTFYSAIKVLTVPKNQQEIKHARSQGMNDDEVYAYFRGLVDNLLNEITLMDNLKGAQNIVGIEDYKIIEHSGDIGWDIFIRMELLTPFDSFVSNPDFSQKDVIRLGVDICTALEACERNYIIHRDIKPDNIFISKFGEYKLGDFGIARKLETTQANLSRKGTLNYMAPEVYKSEEYGSSVDLYSLGLVLYTLLNNNRIAFLPSYPQPITYRDNEEALSKRLSGMPLPLPCNASTSLGEVIVKACSYNACDRYHSATEFKNELIKEWNALVQSGDNKEINSDAMRFGMNMESKLQSTTNDMTANGRLVVDEFGQGTTVLNSEMAKEVYYGSPATDEEAVSGSYKTSGSNKICRVLAWPMAVAICVFAFILMFSQSSDTFSSFLGWPFLGLGVSILIADRNKYSIGASVMALSAPNLVKGIGEFGGMITSGEFSPLVVVWLLSGILFFLSGLVIILQKEVRFGGSLSIYAAVVTWLYFIYLLINGTVMFVTADILLAITAVGIIIWSYGYDSDKKDTGIRKVLYFAAFAIIALMLVQVILFLV